MSSVKVAFGSSRTDVGLRGGGIRAHILSRTLPLVAHRYPQLDVG